MAGLRTLSFATVLWNKMNQYTFDPITLTANAHALIALAGQGPSNLRTVELRISVQKDFRRNGVHLDLGSYINLIQRALLHLPNLHQFIVIYCSTARRSTMETDAYFQTLFSEMARVGKLHVQRESC